jgi:molybdopterin converting factor small subunit
MLHNPRNTSKGSTKNMVAVIELSGTHRDKAKMGKVNMPITEKTVVRDALEYIRKLHPDLLLDEKLIHTMVNHEIAPLDRLLKSNDTVSILPHIGGG